MAWLDGRCTVLKAYSKSFEGIVKLSRQEPLRILMYSPDGQEAATYHVLVVDFGGARGQSLATGFMFESGKPTLVSQFHPEGESLCSLVCFHVVAMPILPLSNANSRRILIAAGVLFSLVVMMKACRLEFGKSPARNPPTGTWLRNGRESDGVAGYRG